MRVASCVSLLAVCLVLAGCKSGPAKSRPSPTAGVPGGSAGTTPFWADSAATARGPAPVSIPGGSADPVGQPGNDPGVSGVLAGRLVDGFGKAPGAAFIQVSKVGDRPGPQVDVETVNQGYFYLAGLQPGRSYRLVARANVGGRLLVGEVQARPPETRLLITMGEDLAGANTPPLPGAPQAPRPRSGAPGRSVSPAAELGRPQAGGSDFGPVTPRPDQIASGAAHAPPQASIPNPTPVAPPGPIQPQSFTVPAASVARPACLIANNRVQYLSLPDVDGGVWDFAQHRGRLVLLDFWGSWCGPCMRAIPKLVELQSHYRDGGLEVIGVACEQGPPAGYARKVRDARQRLPSINYRLVLADEYGRCPVQSQFRITQYPTLVLLDGDGTILWRGGAEKVHELEQILRRRLAN